MGENAVTQTPYRSSFSSRLEHCLLSAAEPKQYFVRGQGDNPECSLAVYAEQQPPYKENAV